MARDDFRLAIGEGDEFAGGRDHAVDVSAGRGVDEGIDAVEEKIAGMQDVRFLKMDVDIGIRVRGRHMGQGEMLPICMQGVSFMESSLRQSLRGRSREFQPQDGEVVRLRHALFRVFVGQNREPRGSQRRVVISVVEVPMRINDELR